MEVCSACGKNSMLPEKYGRVFLCKMCSMKILSPIWKNKNYTSNDEVEKQKQKVIKLANNSNFRPEVMEGLSAFFESKKIDGLIKVFDGNRRQKLTVCETYCIIDTTSNFDYLEAEKAYLKLVKNENRGASASSDKLGEIINNPMTANIIGGIVKGVIPGGGFIANAGKRLVANAVATKLGGRESQGNSEKNRIALHVQTGERVIKYINYDIVRFKEPVGEEEFGFIKLKNSKYEHESEEDVVFFFGQGTETKKEAVQLYEFIRNKVDKNNKVLVDSKKTENSAHVQQVNSSSIADELLKFKQLLDLGAITQQDYEEMKKRLLGM